ncbi:MoaD/ThiS family protein [Candidatus Bipolaricaulota bacterium]|nr:MoaD/ThiS family protein [Candidatus Bipolaricaulota bacterium]
MAIQCRLYGKFKKLASKTDSASGTVGIIELQEKFCKVEDLLGYLDLNEEQISHIIVNGRYVGQGKDLEDGDRVAIFPKELSLLYKWYFD